MIKRTLTASVLILVLLLQTGCWGKTELNEIGIVTITGVDLEPDGSIRITVTSIQPESTGTAAPPRTFTWIGTAVGKNIMDAAKNLRITANKHLTWIHNSVIIIGQKAAEQKMDAVIDFFSRNREVRFSSYILVAEGTAYDILQTPADVQSDLSKEIFGVINNAPEWSKTYVATARDFMVSHAENCGNYITGRIAVAYEKGRTYSPPREEYDKMELSGRKYPTVIIEGCAAFKKGIMTGWLGTDETRGYLWITGDIQTATVVSKLDDGDVAYENNFSKSSVEASIDGKEISFLVKVESKGTLVEQTTAHDVRREEVMKEIEDKISQEIKREMELCVKKLQEQYKTDVLGFQNILHKKDPKLWKELRKDWEDKYFPNIQISYEVKVTIVRTGKLLDSIFR